MNKIRPYRGIRIDGGGWAYGSAVENQSGRAFIIEDMWMEINTFTGKPDYVFAWVEVFPETVGQMTGGHDKNKRDIFEGDIVIVGQDREQSVVTYEAAAFYTSISKGNYRLSGWKTRSVEVTGTVHDHLLKGEVDG